MLYIFDWDGTLVDSADKIVATMHKACQELSLEALSVNQIKNIIGLGLPEAIRTLYPGIEQDQVEKLRLAYSRHFVVDDGTSGPTQFFPGVLSTLNQLKEKGHRVTVATGKSRTGLDRVLKELDMQYFFDSSRCADETASKPDPKMLNELLLQFKVKPEDALMVGDTEWDMAMAQAIDMPRVAVSYGAHSRDRLLSFSPLKCIDHFDELLSIGT